MSYTRELLFNGQMSSSVTLNESVENFERIQIVYRDKISPIFEFDSFVSGAITINASNGYYNNENYLNISNRIEIDSTGKTISVKGCCILGIVNNSPMLYTSTSSSSGNNRVIVRIYGINRKNTSTVGHDSPGDGWSMYNETTLWSGENTSVINLPESASNFERLRIAILSDKTISTGRHYIELDAPVEDGSILTTHTVASTSTTSFCHGWSNWQWSNGCKTLTAQNGKSWTNNVTGSQRIITNNTDISDIAYNKRPILEIIGVNRKV